MSAPNVLWLMTDEQRTDSLGCYGSSWARTPTLDRLAAEGVRFGSAVTPSPVCAPARSSILTGKYPNELGFWHNGAGLDRQALPLTRLFEQAGYRTASFGKHHEFADEQPAFQTQVELLLTDEVGYEGYAESWNQDDFDVVQYPPGLWAWVLAGRFPGDESRTSEARAVASAKAWLGDMSVGDPFFVRLSFNGPHTPVVPPAPFDTCIDPGDIVLPPREPAVPKNSPSWLRDLSEFQSAGRLSDAEIARARQAYYGEVAYLDHLIGDLLAWMDARGLLENLVIAFCSDHGTHLGDFGLIQKQTFFDPVVSVPYIFWGPGTVQPRAAVQTPVEVRSLLPTLLDLADLGHVRDASLAPVLRGEADVEPRAVFSELTLGTFEIRERDRLLMVRDGTWKLTLCLDPEPCDLVLVDLDSDPNERVNRSDDPAVWDVRDRLLALALDHVSDPPLA
jgi:arylsulfatase A-like enzyme